MSKCQKLIKVGVVGCGAIGSRIALAVHNKFKDVACISAICDHNKYKQESLMQEMQLYGIASDLSSLIRSSDLIVEAVNGTATKNIVKACLEAKKDVLVLSVGKLLKAKSLFQLAQDKGSQLLLPSGAIAGLDAFKAASQVGIDAITLTTTKPVAGFMNDPYLKKKKICLENLKKNKIIFQGNVGEAVKAFPRNINVAATLALATNTADLLKVKIVASPTLKRNTHHIKAAGSFGIVETQVENMICPDNPKTSYLAVLSAIQSLKQYFQTIHIGS